MTKKQCQERLSARGLPIFTDWLWWDRTESAPKDQRIGVKGYLRGSVEAGGEGPPKFASLSVAGWGTNRAKARDAIVEFIEAKFPVARQSA